MVYVHTTTTGLESARTPSMEVTTQDQGLCASRNHALVICHFAMAQSSPVSSFLSPAVPVHTTTTTKKYMLLSAIPRKLTGD